MNDSKILLEISKVDPKRDPIRQRLFRSDGFTIELREGLAVINVMTNTGMKLAVTLLVEEMKQMHIQTSADKIFNQIIILRSPGSWKLGNFGLSEPQIQLVAPLILRSFFSSCWNSVILEAAYANSSGIAVNAVPSGVFLLNQHCGLGDIKFDSCELYQLLSSLNRDYPAFKFSAAIGVMCTDETMDVTLDIITNNNNNNRKKVNLKSGDLVYVDLSDRSRQVSGMSIMTTGFTQEWYAFVVLHFVWFSGGNDCSEIMTSLTHQINPTDKFKRIVIGLRNFAFALNNCIEQIENPLLTFSNIKNSLQNGGDVIYNSTYFNNKTDWYFQPHTPSDLTLLPYNVLFENRTCSRDFVGEFAERISICYFLDRKQLPNIFAYTVNRIQHHISYDKFALTKSAEISLFRGVTSTTAQIRNVPNFTFTPRRQELIHKQSENQSWFDSITNGISSVIKTGSRGVKRLCHNLSHVEFDKEDVAIAINVITNDYKRIKLRPESEEEQNKLTEQKKALDEQQQKLAEAQKEVSQQRDELTIAKDKLEQQRLKMAADQKKFEENMTRQLQEAMDSFVDKQKQYEALLESLKSQKNVTVNENDMNNNIVDNENKSDDDNEFNDDKDDVVNDDDNNDDKGDDDDKKNNNVVTGVDKNDNVNKTTNVMSTDIVSSIIPISGLQLTDDIPASNDDIEAFYEEHVQDLSVFDEGEFVEALLYKVKKEQKDIRFVRANSHRLYEIYRSKQPL
jgi:hypothetical protein